MFNSKPLIIKQVDLMGSMGGVEDLQGVFDQDPEGLAELRCGMVQGRIVVDMPERDLSTARRGGCPYGFRQAVEGVGFR
ncbi:hypothetical protein FXW78_15565 [Rhodococcus opacus]|nr:hypothetical protein [Rhodococcus opacus]